MNITVLGATGPTGTHVVDQALAAGHHVTALVRDPARMIRDNPDLTVVQGDATSSADLQRAMSGTDAVISALGSGKERHSDIASKASNALVLAAQATGVRRVIVMSAFGVGESLDHAGRPQRLIVRLMMKDLFADKSVADDHLRRSDLDWTLVYPVTLGDGAGTGRWAAGSLDDDTAPAVTMTSKIQRADVASFLLQQLESNDWLKKTVIVSS